MYVWGYKLSATLSYIVLACVMERMLGLGLDKLRD